MPGHVPAAALWVVSDAGLLLASEIFARKDKKPANLASRESEGWVRGRRRRGSALIGGEAPWLILKRGYISDALTVFRFGR